MGTGANLTQTGAPDSRRKVRPGLCVLTDGFSVPTERAGEQLGVRSARSALLLTGSLVMMACSPTPGMDGGSGGASTGGVSSGSGGAGTGGGAPCGAAGCTGGASATGGSSSSGGSGVGGAASGGSGTGGNGTGGQLVGSCGDACQNAPVGTCTAPEVRVTEVELGIPVLNSDSETELEPLVFGAMPSGGARLGFMSSDSALHIAQLDCQDALIGETFSLAAHDFQDIAADEEGGVAVLTRDARGGGTLNCGEPANLCDGGPSPPVACHEMWMVRFDCAGNVSWETPLTTSSESLPPYSTGPTGDTSLMIWWYQHHGRLAYDGENYAAYFGVAISVSENSCINIHQGDRMRVVGPDGTPVDHPDDFGSWGVGCSHSWNTRIVWDEALSKFVMVCATDNQGRVALPDPYRTIYEPQDLATLSVGDLVVAGGDGYWLTASDVGIVHLLHFTDGMADQDIEIASSDFSHLAAYGENHMIAAWEGGDGITAQVFDRTTGAEVSGEFALPVPDNRYHWLETMADGSVAYAAPGTSETSIRVARVLPCGP